MNKLKCLSTMRVNLLWILQEETALLQILLIRILLKVEKKVGKKIIFLHPRLVDW